VDLVNTLSQNGHQNFGDFVEKGTKAREGEDAFKRISQRAGIYL
jgi:hypothetical protein